MWLYTHLPASMQHPTRNRLVHKLGDLAESHGGLQYATYFCTAMLCEELASRVAAVLNCVTSYVLEL